MKSNKNIESETPKIKEMSSTELLGIWAGTSDTWQDYLSKGQNPVILIDGYHIQEPVMVKNLTSSLQNIHFA